MGNEGMNLLVLNAVAVWIIQAAKSSKYLPFITAETGKINKAVSAVIAAFAAAGVVFGASHTGSVQQGSLTITWAGVTVANVVSFLYHWIGYYWSQKLIFKTAYAPAAPPAKTP